MIINRIIKLLQAVDQQGLNVFKILGGGYSISSHRILKGISLYCKTFGTVIDVGANRGQFALASAKEFPGATIISFEPLPELYAQFKRNLEGYSRVSAHNLALGKEPGTIDFYRNEHSHASSALPISDAQKKAIPETARTTKTQVSVDRLDTVVLHSSLVHPVLLKLDVQGYEKNVLEGATSLLPDVDYLVFEASFIPMYEGEPLFAEMHDYLRDHGFELVAPVGFLEGKKGAILQMDFLYRNRRMSAT